MNWERGFRRISYVIFVLIFLVSLIDVYDNPTRLLTTIGMVLVAFAIYMAFFKAVVWAVRGFNS